jgi:superfamily II DNA/RNA helicase
MDLFSRGKIMLNDCNLLVIDENDRMLDIGFIPDIEKSAQAAQRARPALSATMSNRDQECRQVPERSKDDRGCPARYRQHQYRAAPGRHPRR